MSRSPKAMPFVDVFKALAWDWRELAEGRTERDRSLEWDHPVRYLARRLEELTGISRQDFEEAAWRINTLNGLAPFRPTRGPGGRVSGPDRRDLRHFLTEFRRLDQDGITPQLVEELRDKFPAEPAVLCLLKFEQVKSISTSSNEQNLGQGDDVKTSFAEQTKGTIWELWIACETAPERLDRFEEWPEIRHFACDLFQHPSFDSNTWNRLIDWLMAEHGLRREDNSLWKISRRVVVQLLREAVARKKGSAQSQQDTGPYVSDERGFMELAIQEARKCKQEPGREDVTPSVGALVVRDGKVLARAYRGEFAEGDHAEYTVLEKKLRDDTIAGCTVFCTLEPCTKLHAPKWSCAEWLVARKVARVVIAMLDPNPTIQGFGERQLREAGIDVQRFPKDLADQVEELNRRFIREQKAKGKSPETYPSNVSLAGQSGAQEALNSSIRQTSVPTETFALSADRLPPKLILSFDKETDVVDQSNTVGFPQRVISRWIRIRVLNPNGRKVAKKCEGHLEGIRRLSPDGWEDVPLVGARPLNWEHLPGEPRRDLHAGAEHRLDLLHAADNENLLRLSVYPAYALEKAGTYEFRVRVSAEDSDSEVMTLRIEWKGQWNTLESLASG